MHSDHYGKSRLLRPSVIVVTQAVTHRRSEKVWGVTRRLTLPARAAHLAGQVGLHQVLARLQVAASDQSVSL